MSQIEKRYDSNHDQNVALIFAVSMLKSLKHFELCFYSALIFHKVNVLPKNENDFFVDSDIQTNIFTQEKRFFYIEFIGVFIK